MISGAMVLDPPACIARVGYTGPSEPTLDVLRKLHTWRPARHQAAGVQIRLTRVNRNRPFIIPVRLYDKQSVNRGDLNPGKGTSLAYIAGIKKATTNGDAPPRPGAPRR